MSTMLDVQDLRPSHRVAATVSAGAQSTSTGTSRMNGTARVCLVISNLEYGGAQRQVVELANRIDPRRYSMHICALSPYVPLAKDLLDPGAQLHVLPKRCKFDVTLPFRLAHLLRAVGADIVHGFLFDAEICARLGGCLARTPIIIGSERNCLHSFKRRQLVAYRLTRGLVDCIIANSHAGARFNQRILGHDPGQYRVVHNGVDTRRFQPTPDRTIRQELGIEPDALVVGMFASFKRQKNHPLAFAALRLVFAREPRARFMLVGDELYGGIHGSNAYKRCMEALIDELGIRNRCLFLGNRSDTERLYPACDVTVLPSFHEGTPNVALESMACGVPVVATDVADNAMVVQDGKGGFIVSLGDEEGLADRLVRLLADEHLRKLMGQCARQWVEQEFSVPRLAEKTATVYDEIIRAKSLR